MYMNIVFVATPAILGIKSQVANPETAEDGEPMPELQLPAVLHEAIPTVSGMPSVENLWGLESSDISVIHQK